MLNALCRKKQELEEAIGYSQREIERAETNMIKDKAKLAVVEEMIAEELEKQPKTAEEDPITEAPIDEISLDNNDEIVVIR